MGSAYALVAGVLVLVAGVARQRGRSAASAVAASVAVLSIALPVAVPAALPREEYGVDEVLYLTNPAEPGELLDKPLVCMGYGVEGSETSPTSPDPDPTLCVEFKPSPVARGLDSGDLDAVTDYDVVRELNDRDIRPYDPIEDVGIEGWRSPAGTG